MTIIGSFPLNAGYQPALAGSQSQSTAPHSRQISLEDPAIANGHPLGLLVQQYRNQQPEPTQNDGVETADSKVGASLRWLLQNSDPGSLTDAVHSQLLKTFLVENGLAVTSSSEEINSRAFPENSVPTDSLA